MHHPDISVQEVEGLGYLHQAMLDLNGMQLVLLHGINYDLHHYYCTCP